MVNDINALFDGFDLSGILCLQVGYNALLDRIGELFGYRGFGSVEHLRSVRGCGSVMILMDRKDDGIFGLLKEC